MHILLVDDHTLFREALLHVLNQLDDNVFILEAANAEEAAQLVSRSRSLDLILLNIDLPGVDGLTALPDLRDLAPTVLSSYCQALKRQHMLRAISKCSQDR